MRTEIDCDEYIIEVSIDHQPPSTKSSYMCDSDMDYYGWTTWDVENVIAVDDDGNHSEVEWDHIEKTMGARYETALKKYIDRKVKEIVNTECEE